MRPLLALLSPLAFTACVSGKSIVSENYTIDEVLPNNSIVSVVLVTKEFENSMWNEDVIWWGAEFNDPVTMVGRLTVELDEHSSWVRHSAYSDLVNVKDMRITKSNSGFKLIIKGGQTASLYHAHLVFDNAGYLIRRRVFSPNFPDEVWEETVYSYIKRHDM